MGLITRSFFTSKVHFLGCAEVVKDVADIAGLSHEIPKSLILMSFFSQRISSQLKIAKRINKLSVFMGQPCDIAAISPHRPRTR